MSCCGLLRKLTEDENDHKFEINNFTHTIGLISKKATVRVQHTFLVHFFAVVLHDYNVKLSGTF